MRFKKTYFKYKIQTMYTLKGYNVKQCRYKCIKHSNILTMLYTVIKSKYKTDFDSSHPFSDHLSMTWYAFKRKQFNTLKKAQYLYRYL